MALDSFSITWHPTNVEQLKTWESYYWYVVTDLDHRLYYIGMSYPRTVQERMQDYQHVKTRYAYLGDQIVIWLAEITYTSYQRVNKSMVEAVEALLIYMNQPQDNVNFKQSYTLRNNLRIRSKGCQALLANICIDEGRFSPLKALPPAHAGGHFRPRKSSKRRR